jgi:dUTP diphosphatase
MKEKVNSNEAFQMVQNFNSKLKNKNNKEKEIVVNFVKIHPNAVVPEYAHDGDVGMDLYAVSYNWNEEYDFYEYHTGLKMESLDHTGAFLFPRSSIRKTNYYLANSVGIADIMIYRGEIILCFKDRTSAEMRIKNAGNEAFFEVLTTSNASEAMKAKKKAEDEMKERIKNLEFAPYRDLSKAVGQMVVSEYTKVIFNEVTKLTDTERGEGGFGSTDINK